MKDKIIVLSVNPYSITDEKTGVVNEGLSMQYIMTTDLLPHNNPESGFLGYRVLKGSIHKNNLPDCEKIPALMECDFDIRPDASGKAVLKPTSLKFIKALA